MNENMKTIIELDADQYVSKANEVIESTEKMDGTTNKYLDTLTKSSAITNMKNMLDELSDKFRNIFSGSDLSNKMQLPTADPIKLEPGFLPLNQDYKPLDEMANKFSIVEMKSKLLSSNIDEWKNKLNGTNTVLDKTKSGLLGMGNTKLKIDDSDIDKFKGKLDRTIAEVEQSKIKPSIEPGVPTGNPLVGWMKKLMPGFALFSAYQMAQTLKRAFTSGMEAIESESLFNTTFGGMQDATRAWSEDMRRLIGINPYETRKQASYFMNMYRGFNIAEKKAAKYAMDMTSLSNDFASYFNMKSLEEASSKITSVLAGEVRPLKQYGINLDEATTKSAGLRYGIAQVNKEMTQQEKIETRTRYLQELAQQMGITGDAMRTISSPANQLRIMLSTLKDISIQVGRIMSSAFMMVAPAIIFILNLVRTLVTILASVFQAITGVEKFSFGDGLDMNKNMNLPQANKGLGGINDGLKKTQKGAKKVREEFKKWLAPFDEIIKFDMNNTAPKTPTGGSGGGGVGGADLGAGLDMGNDFKNDVFKLPEGLQKVARVFKKIGDVIRWVGKQFSPLLKSAGVFLGIMTVITTYANRHLWTTGLLGKAYQALVKPLRYMRLAWRGMNTSNKLMVGGLALVIGSFIHLYQNNEKFKKSVDKMAESVKKKAKEIADAFVKMLKDIGLTDFAKDVEKFFSELDISDSLAWIGLITGSLMIVGSVILKLSPLFKLLGSVIGKVFGVIVKFGGLLKTIFMGLGSFIAGLSTPILVVIGVVVAIVALMVAYAKSNKEAMDQVKAMWKAIKDIFGGIKDLIVGLFTKDDKLVDKGLKKIQDGFKSLFDNLGKFILGFGKWIGKFIWDLIAKGLSAIGDFFNGIKIWIGEFFNGLGMWFSQSINGIWNSITKFFSNVWKGISKTASNIASGFLNGAKRGVNNLKGILTWFARLPGQVWNQLKKVVNYFANMGINGGKKAINGLGKILTWAKNLPRNIANAIRNIPTVIANVFSKVRLPKWLSKVTGLASGTMGVPKSKPKGARMESPQPRLGKALIANPMSRMQPSGDLMTLSAYNNNQSSMFSNQFMAPSTDDKGEVIIDMKDTNKKLDAVVDVSLKILNYLLHNDNNTSDLYESEVILDGVAVGKQVFKSINKANNNGAGIKLTKKGVQM